MAQALPVLVGGDSSTQREEVALDGITVCSLMWVSSRSTEHVGAEARKWRDMVVGGCRILFWCLISSMNRKPRIKTGKVTLGVWGEMQRKWESKWSRKEDMVLMHHQGPVCCPRGFPDSSVSKEPSPNAGDPSLIPGLGRHTGEGRGYPLQYSWASLWLSW